MYLAIVVDLPRIIPTYSFSLPVCRLRHLRGTNAAAASALLWVTVLVSQRCCRHGQSRGWAAHQHGSLSWPLMRPQEPCTEQCGLCVVKDLKDSA